MCYKNMPTECFRQPCHCLFTCKYRISIVLIAYHVIESYVHWVIDLLYIHSVFIDAHIILIDWYCDDYQCYYCRCCYGCFGIHTNSFLSRSFGVCFGVDMGFPGSGIKGLMMSNSIRCLVLSYACIFALIGFHSTIIIYFGWLGIKSQSSRVVQTCTFCFSWLL